MGASRRDSRRGAAVWPVGGVSSGPCRRRGPLAIAVALACGAFAEELPASWNTTPGFISDVIKHCYNELYLNSWCCLDEKVTAGVEHKAIDRPGTAWTCSAAVGCDDADYGGGGQRGTDALWTPKGATCSSPRILYMHGGSWTHGSPMRNGYDSLASKFALLSGAVVLVPDYPLVPVGNYSAISDHALQALRWLDVRGPSGRSCPSGSASILVSGDSSGGSSAASLLLRLQVDPSLGPPLAGAVLLSPWLNLMSDTPSYYYNSFGEHTSASKAERIFTGDIIFRGSAYANRKAYAEVALSYVADDRLMADHVASPFHADDRSVRGVPPVNIIVGASEALAGDSTIFARRAAASGAEVHLDLFPGMWHVFPMYSEGCGSGEPLVQAQFAMRRAGAFVRDLVGRPFKRGDAGCPLRAPLVSVFYEEELNEDALRFPSWLDEVGCRASAKPWWRSSIWRYLLSFCCGVGAATVLGFFAMPGLWDRLCRSASRLPDEENEESGKPELAE